MTTNTMPKRKRGPWGREVIDPAQATELKREDIKKKLVHGKKVLNRALKTAKGFERQKLSKRIKLATIQQDSREAGRLLEELDVLKILDLSTTGDKHLYKTLLKTKGIYESGLLPGHVKSGGETGQSSQENISAVSNVTARLYNTKPVKEAMWHIIGSVCAILGIENTYAIVKSKSAEKEVPGWQEDGITKSTEHVLDGDVNELESPRPDRQLRRKNASMDSVTSHPNSGTDTETKDGHSSDNTQNIRAAASSDEGTNRSAHGDTVTGLSGSIEEIHELRKEFSASFSDFSQSHSPPPRPKRPRKEAQERSSKSGSTFLPTLMGGYWSGSESATDEDESSPQKKNRPGQQARRALWEKKYGTGAHHLKGQASSKTRDNDWDPRRGARGAEDDRFTRGRATTRGGKAAFMKQRWQSTGENAVAVQPRARGLGKKDDTGPLHPSWEAAKKAKQAKQSAAFEGKKVVFE